MPLKIYGYLPAWDLPDISPYVTKLVAYLKIKKISYEYINQDLTKLDDDAPYGKLPYVIDDDGIKIGDSQKIIEYLESKSSDPLDKGLSASDKAVCLAFERMTCEHLYFSGILEPRWRQDSGFETYIPYIVQGAEVTPELRGFLDQFRARIVANFDGQGMGRRDSEYVYELFKADIDALSGFMGDKKYFFDDQVRTIDAAVYPMLKHTADQPQQWKGTGYVYSKNNLSSFMGRMRVEFDV